MSEETFAVRPLGKYGHTYILDKKTHRFYQAFTVTIYSIIIALGFYQILIAPLPHMTSIDPDVFYLLLFGIAIFGMGGVLRIASKGRVIYGQEADSAFKAASKETRSKLADFGILAICIFSGLFSFALGLGILSGILFHQPVSLAEVIILFIGLYSFIYYCRRC